LLWFAAEIAAVHLAACGTKCRRLGAFRDVAAAGRFLNKSAHDALFLIGFAARFATLDLAALGAEFDATLGLSLLATVTTQQ